MTGAARHMPLLAGLITLGLGVGLVGQPTSATPELPAAPELPAFPGAEGFGAGATGGRGGSVVIVSTLEPFGPGSLGEALAPEVCEPRTIVFAVSGVIVVPGRHDLELTCGNVTIAGQTAPGAGITVSGRIDAYGADPGGNIIMRHIRLRPPPITSEEGAVDDLGLIYDALQMSNNPNSIFDHLSLSWGSDETADFYEYATDVTVQWTTIEQSNPEGQVDGPHNDGLIFGPGSPRATLSHVLFAHHRARCPAMSAGPAELVNSIIYDCQDGFVHHNPAAGEFHIAGNTFIHGPSHTEFTPIYLDDEEPGGTTYWLFQNDIQAPGQFEGVVDDIATTPLAEAAFSAGADPSQVISEPSDFSTESDTYVPVTVQSPQDAAAAVLEQAGAFPRDGMTFETIDDVRNGTGSWEPNPPADLLDGLSPTEPPPDADSDGMADAWELEHGLDPSDGTDHAVVMPSGYTAIEEYINELADQLTGTGAAAAPPSTGPAVPVEGSTTTSPPPVENPSTPWEQELANVAPDGTRSLESLLLLFAMVFGPIPGVEAPLPGTEIASGSLVVNDVLDRFDELTPEQQAAVTAALVPPPGAETVFIPDFGDPAGVRAAGFGQAPPSGLADAIVDAITDLGSQFQGKLGYVLPGGVTVVIGENAANDFGFMVPTFDAGVYSGCTVTISSARNTDAILALNTSAHELFHCFQAAGSGTQGVWKARQKWWSEGSAAWAAAVVTTPDGTESGWWETYLASPAMGLFQQSYSGIGFFAHLAETGTDPWTVLPAIFAAGSNEGAFAASGADNPIFLSSWGSSRLREPARGAGWDTTGPGIGDGNASPQQFTVADGETVTLAADSYSTNLLQATITAEIVTVSATQGYIHMNDGAGVEVPIVASTPYCTRPGGCGVCPDNTPLPNDPQPLAATPVFGMGAGAVATSGTITGQTVEDYCIEHQHVWVHLERPAMDGVLAGTVIELYGCQGPFGAWSGVLRTGGLDSGSGFTVPFSEIPVSFAFAGDHVAQSAHADASGNVPTPAGDFAVTFALDFSVDGAGTVMSITGSGTASGMIVEVTAAFPGAASGLPIQPAPAGTCA